MGEVAAEVAPYEVAGASTERRALVRPYAPSWLDRLFDRLTELPGPTWLAYLGLLVPVTILNNSALWLSGLLPPGQLDPAQTTWGVVTVAILAASHHLREVAGSSFDDFQPALGHGVADPERARYELVTMPSRPVLGLTLFSIVITPLYYVADPVAAQVIGVSAVGLLARGTSEALTSAILLAILFQAIRQMRRVGRLHEAVDRVDPFRPTPLYAFSRLTARAGIILILFNTAGILLIVSNTAGPGASPAAFSESALGLYAPWFAGFIGGAIVIFVVPLLGMHRRLETAKDQLDAAAGERLATLLSELNEAIDARATDRVDAVDRTIAALRREREIISKLPTWPWSLGTIRGFGSALFLPIVLFLIQRVLGQLLG